MKKVILLKDNNVCHMEGSGPTWGLYILGFFWKYTPDKYKNRDYVIVDR